MSKEIRKYYDPRLAKSFNVNVNTGIVCGTDGVYPDKSDETRIFNAVQSRIRSQRSQSERDQLMRDCGLIKVRGAVSGHTYWE